MFGVWIAAFAGMTIEQVLGTIAIVTPAKAGVQEQQDSVSHPMIMPCVYIMASRRNGTLYVGVTSDLPKRVWEHREGKLDGFTRRYAVKLLVYYEVHATMEYAIVREKQIKEWRRAWKLRLIEEFNPEWRDLHEELNG